MEMTKEQLELITNQLATIKERSPFYAKKFEGIDVTDVRTQADFEKLPFSEKDDLRAVYPLGLQAVPDEEVVRIHSSSGTTGTPASVIDRRAEILSPIRSIVSARGPMNVIPATSHFRANPAFSDRKPYPGWTASAPHFRAVSMILSTSR